MKLGHLRTFGLVVVLLLGVFAAVVLLPGRNTIAASRKIGVPQDWSHRHLIFSNPASNPANAQRAIQIQQDPRYWHQYFRRNVSQALPTASAIGEEFPGKNADFSWLGGNWPGDWFGWFHIKRNPPAPRNAMKRDWAVSLGPNTSVGAGNYPAKFSFDITTANCGNATQPDFVVYNTGVNGSATQATIVAYDNIYSGCGGTVPTTYWAYDTGGIVNTSVVLSGDGSQIAFVQSNPTASTVALVLVKWAASTNPAVSSTNPDAITQVTNAQYPTCTAPCLTQLISQAGISDTFSSPFYDYAHDALYVGADNGDLYFFQPVFSSVPFLASFHSIAPGLKLSSPVYDFNTGRIFVGSGWNGTTGSQLFAVNTAGTVVGTSSPLGTGNGIVASPIVDSGAGKVYVFVGTDNSTACGGGACSGVYQFNTNFTNGAGSETIVQRGSNPSTFTLYPGTFDNNYYNSGNGTGNLYVCGNTLGSATLYQIPITAGTMGSTAVAGPQLAGVFGAASNAPCSPVTEIFNPNVGGASGTDKIFVSTTGGGTNPCGTGCIYDMPVTVWQPNTTYTVGEEVVDSFLNIQVVTTAGTSGATTPLWSSPGNPTFDNTVIWRGKEGLGTTSAPLWQANNVYSTGTTILDTNGNFEVATTRDGQSGTVQPTWPPTVGGSVLDGSQTWVNVGPPDNFVLSVTGGTSGVIIDNVVPSGTLAGGSQVYFSPLGTGFSTCGAGNGCAVQASQAGLN